MISSSTSLSPLLAYSTRFSSGAVTAFDSFDICFTFFSLDNFSYGCVTEKFVGTIQMDCLFSLVLNICLIRLPIFVNRVYGDYRHCVGNCEIIRKNVRISRNDLLDSEASGGDPKRPPGGSDRRFVGVHLCGQSRPFVPDGDLLTGKKSEVRLSGLCSLP